MKRIFSGMAATALCCSSVLAAGAAAAPKTAPALPGSIAVGGRFLPAPSPALGARSSNNPTTGSFNWSGYAQSGAPTGTYTGVTATFKVPTVNISLSGKQFSSDWVGIGGFSDSTLVQAGIEADNLNGTAFYQAWTEIIPAAENPLTLVIHAGDTVKVTVLEIAANKWKMTVKDVTLNTTASRTVVYTSSNGGPSSRASVEAITERPCIKAPCNTVSDLATLAKTTNETYDPGNLTTTAPGTTPLYHPLLKTVAGATLNDIAMLANNGTTVIATPSNPDSDNDGFTVQDGNTIPPPPPS
jgi:Peptidase A4 family